MDGVSSLGSCNVGGKIRQSASRSDSVKSVPDFSGNFTTAKNMDVGSFHGWVIIQGFL